MYGSRLDIFYVAGREGTTLQQTECELELQAYQLGRKQAGIGTLETVKSKHTQGEPRESYKSLAIVHGSL